MRVTSSKIATIWANIRQISQVGIPLLVSSASDLIASLLLVIIVGRLGGVEALAPIAIAVALYQVVGQTAGSMSMGFFIATTMEGGATGDSRDRLSGQLRAGLVICAGTAVIGALLLLLFSPSIVTWFGDDPQVQSAAVPVIRVYAVAFIFVLIGISLNYYLLAQQKARPGMVAAIAGNIVVLSSAFVLVPSLGAVGAATATAIGELLSTVLLAWHVFRGGGATIRGKLQWADIARQVRLALPETVNNGLDYVGVAVWVACIATLGSAAVAVNHSVLAIYMLVFSALMSFSTGAQVAIGRAMGRRSVADARLANAAGLTVGLVSGVVIGGVFAAISPFYPGLALPDSGATGQEAVALLVLLLAVAPFMGASSVELSTIKASGRTGAAAAINLAPLWVFQVGTALVAVWMGSFSLLIAYCGFLAYMAVRTLLAWRVVVRIFDKTEAKFATLDPVR